MNDTHAPVKCITKLYRDEARPVIIRDIIRGTLRRPFAGGLVTGTDHHQEGCVI